MSSNADSGQPKPSRYRPGGSTATSQRGVEGLTEMDHKDVIACIKAVLNAGDAIMFGCTRDGGALNVSILSGGTAEKFYMSGVDETSLKLAEIEEVAASFA